MKIIEKVRISPPQGSVPDSSSLPLTFLDVIWIDSNHVQRCFFFNYPHSTSHFLHSHLPNLKSSLSLTLHHFYPLAGKFRLSPDSKEERYEIYYKEGDSVTLAIAENESDEFVDVAETKPHDPAKVKPLIPEPNDDLLAIQLTIFPNNGICIAFSIHHAACDGFSYTHFVKSWASICKSGSPLPPTMVPSVDRTISQLDGLRQYYVRYLKERREFKSMLHHKSETKTEALSTIFRISLEQIERLKMSVQAKANFFQKSLPYCSAYIVSSAYTWSCHVKLHKYSEDQTICFMLPVDWRKRLEPPAPAMYFGTCVLHSFVEMKAGDLVRDEGVMLACEAIGNKIKELENGIVSSVKRGVEDKAHIFAGHPISAITGSNRFGVYGVDFGWGRPIKVEVFVDNEGFYMAENGDESKSVEIGVVLPKLQMKEFATIFEDGLACLSEM